MKSASKNASNSLEHRLDNLDHDGTRGFTLGYGGAGPT